MKLLIATGLYAPEIGGPATYTKLLEERLPAKGYQISVVPFAASRHLPKVFRHVHYFVLLLLRARQADVVFAQDTVSVGLPAMLAAKFLRKPFVIRVPGDYAWEQSVQRYGVTDTIDEFQTKRQKLPVRILQAVQAIVVRSANLVISPSRYFRDLVTKWGADPAMSITIYNGVDLNMTPILPTKPTQKTIVTAGRLVAWKGISGLFEVVAQLPEWQLVIIGDGPQRAALEAQAKEQGVLDRVTFTGSLAREAVFGWCVAADAFVLNTSFESFSYQVVEAMFSGTPVIVTNVGSLPELIEDTVQGVLVDPQDISAIRRHVLSTQQEPELWNKRTAAAKEKVALFTIDRCLERLDRELQSLL